MFASDDVKCQFQMSSFEYMHLLKKSQIIENEYDYPYLIKIRSLMTGSKI